MTQSDICVGVNAELFVDLHSYARSKGSSAAVVIHNVMSNFLEMQEKFDGYTARSADGYRWKSLILPSGTKVRMRYGSSYYYAEVEGDDFVWNGSRSSPAKFANGVTGTSRSAWRDLEIRRPSDQNWVPAMTLKPADEQ